MPYALRVWNKMIIIITSQRHGAWQCHVSFLKGKCFSPSRPGKTNKYFGTKLGKRDYLGKIYKLTKSKCGADRIRIMTILWLSSLIFVFFQFPIPARGKIRTGRDSCTACMHVEQTKVIPTLIGLGYYRRCHFSSLKPFSDVADVTHRGAMWANKRKTRWI